MTCTTRTRPARAALALLVLVVLATAALARGAPAREAAPSAESIRARAAEARAAAGQRDWARAESAWREAALLAAERLRARPDDFDLAHARDVFTYDAACAAALQGRREASLELLEDLVGRGWLDGDDVLARDADFAALRDDPRFGALHERARALVAGATRGFAEGLVLVPAQLPAVGPRPGIVALHGGGGNVESWAAAWQAVADRTGAVVVLVRGSLVQGRGVFSWDQRRSGREAARLEEWLARARERVPLLSRDEIYLAGFSQGGGLALLLAFEGTRDWHGVIAMSPYVQVAERARLDGSPARPLAIHAFVAEADEVPIREVATALAERSPAPGLRVALEVVPGGHRPPRDLPVSVARAMRSCRKARRELAR